MKLELYRRMGKAGTEGEVATIREELIDRFGDRFPRPSSDCSRSRACASRPRARASLRSPAKATS